MRFATAFAVAWTAMLLLGPTSSRADILKTFEFDEDGVLPSADPEIELFTAGASATETDVYSVSGGLLEQRTFSEDGNYSYSFPDSSLLGGGIDPTRDLVMEARLRILDIQGTDGVFFEAFDGLNRYGPLFEETGLVFFDAGNRGPSVDLTDLDLSAFHTYRVESPGGSSSFTFSVDGQIVFTGVAAASRFNGFEWGDGLSTGGNGANVDWDFVRFAQPIPPSVPDIAKHQTDGPLRQDGLGGMEPFDLDGDGNDLGAVIGVSLDHSQSYAFASRIINADPISRHTALQWFGPISPIALDEITKPFAFDPDFEDFYSDGLIDGVCGDGLPCDGIVEDPTCPVTVIEPSEEDSRVAATVLIEADLLPDGAACTTRFFVATTEAARRGRSRRNARFQPTRCVTATSDGGTLVTDTVTLNPGLKLFDGITNDLLAGPAGSIQLKPVGCQ
jgi:hypothetical protein